MDQDWLAAFEALKSVYIDGAYSNIAINEAVSHHKGVRESFVRTFTKGVLRDSIRLDYIIDKLVERGIGSVKPRLLIILRMGLYAVDEMYSIPEYAAVNETVNLAKGLARGSERFINGVLRGYLRRRGSTYNKESLRPDIACGFSKEVFDLLRSQYGPDALRIAEALNEPPNLYLRTNTLKIDRDSLIEKLKAEGFSAEASTLNDAAILASGSGIASSDIYRSGLCSIQSLSSMIAVKALDPAPGSKVLDICAAPGGKSTYMAEIMGNKGSITACDIHSHRLDLIKAYAARTGVDIIDTVQSDASVYNESLEGTFDYVLADVPCSGLGVVASKPEIRLSTDTSKYDELIELQKKIAWNAFRYLKPGGHMMYSTCTLNKNENEELAKHLLSRASGSAVSIEMRTIMPYNGEVGFFYDLIEKTC